VKRKEIFLSALSGILLALTLEPFQWKWLVWVGLVPLLWALGNTSFLKGFFLGVITGAVYFSALLSWIPYYNLGIFFLALPCTLLFSGLFAGLTAFVYGRLPYPLIRALAPALLWTGLEYIYGLTPLGSAAFHLEVIQNLPLLQIISLSGCAPIIFAFLLINALLASCVRERKKLSFALLIFTVAGIVVVWNFGRARLTNEYPGTFKAACIQPNFPISDAWRQSHQDEIFETYRVMALEAARQGARLIVFPQYALPADVYHAPEPISKIAQACQAYLVLGTYVENKERNGKYNIALVFSPDGKIIGEYRAVRPPPFRRIGQIRGTQYSVIETPLARLGILLCYDDVEPKVARELVRNGAQLLIELSNNGHFGKSKLLSLHFTKDILRAAETRRFVLRSATTGISAAMDPRGRVLARTQKEKRQMIFAEVSPLNSQTFFVKHGDIFTPLAALAAGLMLVAALRSPSARV